MADVRSLCVCMCVTRQGVEDSMTPLTSSVRVFKAQRRIGGAYAHAVTFLTSCDDDAYPLLLVMMQVVTRDGVVAADGAVYARAAIKSWITECLRGTCATAIFQRLK
jgi:hypothetical protein